MIDGPALHAIFPSVEEYHSKILSHTLPIPMTV